MILISDLNDKHCFKSNKMEQATLFDSVYNLNQTILSDSVYRDMCPVMVQCVCLSLFFVNVENVSCLWVWRSFVNLSVRIFNSHRLWTCKGELPPGNELYICIFSSTSLCIQYLELLLLLYMLFLRCYFANRFYFSVCESQCSRT